MEAENEKKIQLTCSSYVVEFDNPDFYGNIFNKESVDIDHFEQMKISGDIVDYEIDDKGVFVIKKFDLKGVKVYFDKHKFEINARLVINGVDLYNACKQSTDAVDEFNLALEKSINTFNAKNKPRKWYQFWKR